MVVPIERVGRSSDKLKKFVGNNLNVNVANNKITLAVTGNNCKIKIEENSGLIRVVGDRCDVTVLKGDANIDYVGNCGRIHLGRDVSDNTVTYVGNQGEVSTLGADPDANNGKTPKPTRVAGDSGETVNISNSTRIRMANTGFPNNINVSFPVIRIGRLGQRLGRNS